MRCRGAFVGLVLVLLAGACGDDDDDDTAGTGASSGSSTTADDGETDDTGDATSSSGATSSSAAPDGGDGCTEERIGGEITMGMGVLAPNGLEPIAVFGASIAGGDEIMPLYDTLVRYVPDEGVFEPFVAEALESNADATVWTLTLRDGITFGNGDPLTADAVRFNVERVAGSTVSASGMANLVASMEVIDPLTIEFTLTRPWGGFPYYLSGEGGMIVNPAVVEEMGDEFASNPVGAGVGPYEVERWAPGEELVLRSKDDYWGGPVCIEQLRFVPIAGGQAQYDAFRNGELDLMFVREANVIAEVRADGVAELTVLTGGQGLLFNVGRGESPVLADVRARQAIAHAIDPEIVDERVFGGQGLMSTSLAHPDQRVYPGVEGPQYDPELATELLEEARADGFGGRVRIVCDNSPARVEFTIAFEAMLESIGFEVEVENLPSSDFFARVVEGNFDVACGSATVYDESAIRGVDQFSSTSPRSRVGIADPDLDAAIDALYAARDEPELIEAMGAFQEVWNRTLPGHMLWAEEWMIGIQDRVHGMVGVGEGKVAFNDAWIE